jgi:hypothetical protein
VDWPDLGRGVPHPAPEPQLRRRVEVAALALAVAAGGFFLAVRAFERPQRAGRTNASPSTLPTPTPGVTPASTAGQVQVSPSPLPERGVFGAMMRAIRDSSPAGVQFALESHRLDGDWSLDGNVDDGSGPGRLMVNVTVRPGMLEAHPCADAEFSGGAQCVERRLASGDLLALRGVLLDHAGLKTIEAVLVHPDGSGTGAEAGNFAMPPGGGTRGGGGGATLQKSREDIIYSVDQLGALVRAVDEAARACIAASC